MTRRDIPNLISITRILLVWPFAQLLMDARYGAALGVFALLGASDALDGWLARRNGWQSRLGAILDPLADKVLLVGAYLALGSSGLVPLWLVALVILRDLVIVSGATVYRWLFGALEMRPLLISKANTGFQVLLVLAVVFSAGLMTLPPVLLTGLQWLVAATTVASGVAYVWLWASKAVDESRRRR